MTSRRAFLKSGLAASAAFNGALSLWPAAASADAQLALERFVFDRRFHAAVRAARLAAARGIRLAETAGDLTSLWYHDLDLRWRRKPMALAGVTTRGALFVLETLAADRGMRVLYRGEHGATDPGRAAHRFAGPAELFADLLPPELKSGMPAVAEHGDTLFSWIIAPRSVVTATV